MSDYFVGGYYKPIRVYSDDSEEECLMDENVLVYDMNSVIKLGFLSALDEYCLQEYKKEFDDLSNKQKVSAIIDYCKDDELAGLFHFDNLKDAIANYDYHKLRLKDFTDNKKKYEYIRKDKDSYGFCIDIYK